MSNKIIRFQPKPLDVLCEAHPGLSTASTAVTTTMPSATYASTMAFTGRTNLTVPPEDWRKPQRRRCYAALDAKFPHGLPIEVQMKRVVEEVETYCLEKGWPKPKAKTVHRAIHDRYFALTCGST